MEEIYAKIQMTEEYLRDLRTKLQASEEEHKALGKDIPYALSTVTVPFVNATCASARAAVLSCGVRMD
jgi:hypothetical protein